MNASIRLAAVAATVAMALGFCTSLIAGEAEESKSVMYLYLDTTAQTFLDQFGYEIAPSPPFYPGQRLYTQRTAYLAAGTRPEDGYVGDPVGTNQVLCTVIAAGDPGPAPELICEGVINVTGRGTITVAFNPNILAPPNVAPILGGSGDFVGASGEVVTQPAGVTPPDTYPDNFAVVHLTRMTGAPLSSE